MPHDVVRLIAVIPDIQPPATIEQTAADEFYRRHCDGTDRATDRQRHTAKPLVDRTDERKTNAADTEHTHVCAPTPEQLDQHIHPAAEHGERDMQ